MSRLPRAAFGSPPSTDGGGTSEEPVAHWVAVLRQGERIAAQTLECRGDYRCAAAAAVVFARTLIADGAGSALPRGVFDPEELLSLDGPGPGAARARHRRGQPVGDHERGRARPGTRRTQPMARPRGLRRQAKVLLGVAALVTCVAAFAAYLDVHYVDVVRYSAEQGRVTVERAELGRLGTVLVTNKGFALYTFPPDAAQHVTCTGDCASAWPPLTLHTGETAAAGTGGAPACWGRCRIRAAAASSPITDGRYTPTSAMHLPVRRPARARTTTAVTGRGPPVRTDRQPVAGTTGQHPPRRNGTLMSARHSPVPSAPRTRTPRRTCSRSPAATAPAGVLNTGYLRGSRNSRCAGSWPGARAALSSVQQS